MRATEANILNFVGGLDKVFVIPPFQRNYQWEELECEELFNDIIKSLETNQNHYLGNVVYYISSLSNATFQQYVLVDGQQRITTVLLLLCAIRDISEEDLGINSRYLTNNVHSIEFVS